MGPVSFAFSVHNFISSVGADAGFAAIVGLAILVLLYFAHARETANLREEAEALSQRLQQAEAAVAQLSRAQAAAPAPPPASVQVTDQREQPAVARAPFAPAGMGAPALAAATRVVPLASPPSEQALAAAPQASPPAPPPPSTAEPRPAPAPAVATAAAAASTATAAGAPAAQGRPSSGIPRPATAAGGNGSTREPVRQGAGTGTLAAVAAARPAGSANLRTLPPLADSGGRRSSIGRRVALAVGALLVVGAAVALVAITATSSSSNKTTSAQTTNAPAPVSGAAAFKPASVTVAVLNGTSTNELAHRVAAKLATSGYRQGRVATASNQTETKTVVAYLPGGANRRDALHVASALKLTAATVQPIDQATQQVACPPPSACPANVVVTVGADLARL